jgi:hypothetical protein
MRNSRLHVRKKQHKLLAAEATNDIAAARMFFQQLCKHPQYFVASQMAVCIVDEFEMIEVAHHDSGRLVVARRAGQFMIIVITLGWMPGLALQPVHPD